MQPAGADGGLDFQCIFAGSEQKLAMQLKNRGKYDIGFAFSFNKASNDRNYSDLFKVTPATSVLYSGEKSQTVNVVFCSNREVAIKDEPVLKCQVLRRYNSSQFLMVIFDTLGATEVSALLRNLLMYISHFTDY